MQVDTSYARVLLFVSVRKTQDKRQRKCSAEPPRWPFQKWLRRWYRVGAETHINCIHQLHIPKIQMLIFNYCFSLLMTFFQKIKAICASTFFNVFHISHAWQIKNHINLWTWLQFLPKNFKMLHLLHQCFKPVNPNRSNTLETWLLPYLLTSPGIMTEKWRAIDFRWWIEITCICDINLHIFKISKLYISICLRGHMIYLLLKIKKKNAPISSVHTITHVKHFNVSTMWNSELLLI